MFGAQCVVLAIDARREEDAEPSSVPSRSSSRASQALRFRDVDFANATLRVRRNLPVGATREKAPKGGKPRPVPLVDQAARELDTLSRRGYLTGPDDRVFLAATGRHLDYEHTKDAFYAALVNAGLGHLREQGEPVTFHDLRHTFGTRMAAAGRPGAVVCRSGWATRT